MKKIDFKLEDFQKENCPSLNDGQLVIHFKGKITYRAFNYWRHLEELSDDMENLFYDKVQTDFTIQFNEQSCQAHKSILSVRSPYFASKANFETIQESLSGIKVETFEKLMQFLYTGVLLGHFELDFDLLVTSIKVFFTPASKM